MASSGPRKRLLGVSTKLYFDIAATEKYLQQIPDLVAEHLQDDNCTFFVIPTFLSLQKAGQILGHYRNIKIGAQDCFWEDSGAFTGEISPKDLAQLGVRYVELGHAERRRIFGETDDWTGKKAAAVAGNGMVPLVCIGERTREQGSFEAGVATAVKECEPQIRAVVDAIPSEAELVLAYEPIWAIGKSEPASADYVVAVTKEIRKLVEHRKGLTYILYGGSAGPGLFEKLAEGVDGLFLGRFAHDPQNLRKTVQEVVSFKLPASG